jgi:hypothetical protein
MARRSTSPARPTKRPAPSRRAPAAAAPPAEPTPQAATARPDVIVDFSVDRGLLFVLVHNIGGASAYQVVTRFNQPFHGLGGRKDLSRLALFKSLLFLPPGKQISQLVDHLDAYFLREEPTELTATLTYADRDGRRYKDVVPHDLAIYRDLVEPLQS